MALTREESGAFAPLSVRQVYGRGKARATLAMFGPAFVAAIAYVDPGNFSTNFSAGSQYGYRLVWVVVLANLMAMPVQFLSAKVGIVTGKSLPEVCRDHCSPKLRIFLWLQAEVVAIATDLAEFVGAAIGLYLLFGVPGPVAGLITAAAAFAVLGLQVRGSRPFERAIFFLLLIVFGGFGYQLLHTGGGPGAGDTMGSALIPSFAGSGSIYLSAGIVGATMMPHVVYLHSAMTSRRLHCFNDDDRRTSLRFERWDVVVALGFAGLINVSMMIIAARVFFSRPHSESANLIDIHSGLATYVGGGTALAFAVALVASGISSSSVGTFAGQTVMAGFLQVRIPLLLRRAVTMLPALAVVSLRIDSTRVLNLSQVLLSFGIPFALVPLILVTRSKNIMGSFANSRLLNLTMSTIVALVVCLNLALIAGQLLD